MTTKSAIKILLLSVFCMFFCSGIMFAQSGRDRKLLDQADELSYEGQIKHAQQLMNEQTGKKAGKSAEKAPDGWDGTSLMLGMIWGAIGAGYFLYGRKQPAPVFLFCGVILMIFPMFVADTMVNLIVGLALTIIPFKVVL